MKKIIIFVLKIFKTIYVTIGLISAFFVFLFMLPLGIALLIIFYEEETSYPLIIAYLTGGAFLFILYLGLLSEYVFPYLGMVIK